jgi:SNF2 family DNA or RNA helicase
VGYAVLRCHVSCQVNATAIQTVLTAFVHCWQILLLPKMVEEWLVLFPAGSPHETIHNMLYRSARLLFVEMMRTDEENVLKNFMKFLELVLRIRQASCHASLIPRHRREDAQKTLESIMRQKELSGHMELDPLLAQELLDKLKGAIEEDEETECAICFEPLDPENAVILRKCKHVLCQECIDNVEGQICPFCRTRYTESDKIEMKDAKKALKLEDQKGKDTNPAEKYRLDSDDLGRSPKMQAMINAIGELDADEKCVIFSQWTSMLDIIQAEFDALDYTYCRIDGRMNTDERIQAMNLFDSEECDTKQGPRFILCSMHACGTGINLTRGNVVFMMDPWWNAAVENQVS